MRTKAEALAAPLAGGRWEVPDQDWPWNELAIIERLASGEVRGRYADATSTVMTAHGFRAYCTNAEYLGGTNE